MKHQSARRHRPTAPLVLLAVWVARTRSAGGFQLV
jgi:hypothetical protein